MSGLGNSQIAGIFLGSNFPCRDFFRRVLFLGFVFFFVLAFFFCRRKSLLGQCINFLGYSFCKNFFRRFFTACSSLLLTVNIVNFSNKPTTLDKNETIYTGNFRQNTVRNLNRRLDALYYIFIP